MNTFQAQVSASEEHIIGEVAERSNPARAGWKVSMNTFQAQASALGEHIIGEVAERSKAHAWKVCIPLKGIAGSNPALSATKSPCFRKGFLYLEE